MRFASFASGSSGNCSVLSCDETHLMIDAGISNKKIETRLAESGLDCSDISGICITHEHTDHINGLRVFLKKHPVHVYATAGTLDAIERNFNGDINSDLFEEIHTDQSFSVGDLSVLPFSVDHDAADPCSFRITDGTSTFAVATDLGKYTDYTINNLSGLDFLMLEANHDIRMLEVGPYPYNLKKRILGDSGHLSNETAGALAAEVLNEKMDTLLLCHLSRENNYPELAKQAVRLEVITRDTKKLSERINIETAPRDAVSQFFYF